MNRNPSGDSHLTRNEEGRVTSAFWILVFVIASVPLILAPGLQYLEITPKLIVLVGGACLVWLALAAENSVPAPRQGDATFLSLLGGLALLSVVSTVFSQDAVLSLAGSEGRRLGLPAWLASLALAAAVPVVLGNDPVRRRRLLGAMAVAGALAAAYGLAQYAGYDPWINPALYRVGTGEMQTIRPPSTLGHADWFAVFLLFAGFSAAGLALSSATARERIGWAVAVLVMAAAIVISGSRGAWLGGAVGMVALGARIRNRRPILVGLLAASALAALFVISPWGRPLRNRFRTFADDPGIQARVLVWRDSLRLIAAQPLLGTGPDAFELGFPSVQSAELSRLAPENYVESPHNIFLDYLTNAGVPAGLIFAALLVMAFWRFGVSSQKDALDAGLLGALAAGLVAMQFIGDTISTRLAMLTVVALSARAPTAPAREAIRDTNRNTLRLTVGSLALGCLILATAFGSRLVQADRALLLANRAAGRSQVDAALQEGLRARQSFPWAGAHALSFSRTLAQLAVSPVFPPAERDRMLGAAEEAARAGLLHTSQPQMAYVHLASLLVLQNRRKEARAALDAAVEAAPGWYRPRWLLAILLAGQGELKPGAAYATAALNLGARNNPEVAANCLKIIKLASEIEIPEPLQLAAAGKELRLSYDHAIVHPRENRGDTPNNRWAFPFGENSLVTLADSNLTFAVEIPALPPHSKVLFRASVRMPIAGADPASAVLRVNGRPVYSKLLRRAEEVSLDFSPFAEKTIQLELAAAPSPDGQRGSWVEWVDPRIAVEPAP